MDSVSPVELHLLERMLADRSRDGLRSLDDYLAAFPDHREIVTACFRRVTEKWTESEAAAAVGAPRELGRFRLQRIAGRGGQGTVWQAEDPRLGRQVAVKVLSLQFGYLDATTRMRQRARFEREAAVAARLEHPGICTVYEVGDDGDVPWIAMQWVDGESLDRVVARCRQTVDQPAPLWHEDLSTSAGDPPRVRIRAIATLVEGAARAVHAAHQKGLVHRDLKPGNLMLTPGGGAVVLDFGLALDESADAVTLTGTGEAMGSPAYMPPEQLDEAGADGRSDVYSLGVTLYECLSLRRPYDESTRERLYRAIRLGTRPDLRRLVPAVSRDLAQVISRATDTNPNRRYATAADFADDLGRAVAGEAILARANSPGVRFARLVRAHPAVASLVVVVLVLAITVVTVQQLEADRFAPAVRAQESAKLSEAMDQQLARAWLDYSFGRFDRAIADFLDASNRAEDDDQICEGRVGAILGELRASRPDRARALVTSDAAGLSECMNALMESQVLRSEGRHAEAAALEAQAPPAATTVEKLIAGAGAIGRGLAMARDDRLATIDEAYEQSLQAVLTTTGPPRLSAYAQLAQIVAHGSSLRARRTVANAVASLWPNNALAAYWTGLALGGPLIRVEGAALEPDERPLVEAAVSAYETAAALDPSFAMAHVNLGMCLALLGETARAEAAYRGAIAADPKLARGHSNLGLILEQRGDLDAAIESYRRAVSLSDNPVFRVNLSAALSASDETDEAMAAIASEEERDTPATSNQLGAVMEFNRGRLLDALGKEDEALAAYRRAIEMDTGLAQAHNNVGTILHTRGDHDGALAAYRRTIELDAEHPRAWINIGFVLKEQKQYAQALEALRRGHVLGSATAGWSHDSAAWVEECEALLRAQRGKR